MFRDFLQSEFSDENLEFWIACQEYKNLKDNKLAAHAQKIYVDFVAVQAPREVGESNVVLKGTNRHHNGHMGKKNVKSEIMVEIYPKSLVRAIGKELVMIVRTLIKIHKGDGKWPLFVNKQLFCWSASILLDNNNGVLTDFYPFFLLYTSPHTSVCLTCCICNAFSVLNFF